MKHYIVYKIETTPAHLSIDGKAHKHKYYLYPIPDRLKTSGFNFSSCWSYEKGKRGALKFTSKAEASRIAKRFDALVEQIE